MRKFFMVFQKIGNYQIKVFTSTFQFQSKYSLQLIKMSLRKQKTNVLTTNEGMSKREQRKLQQTLKLFDTYEPKPKKKRKASQKLINMMPPNKEKETPAQIAPHQPQQLDNIAQTKEQTPANSTPINEPPIQTMKKTSTTPKVEISFLNKGYLKEESWSQFWQMQSQFQKRNKTYEHLDLIGQPLLINNSQSLELLHQKDHNFHNRFRDNSDKRPFSKCHLQYSSWLSSLAKR